MILQGDVFRLTRMMEIISQYNVKHIMTLLIKNNNVSFEGLDIPVHYYYYHSLSYHTCYHTSYLYLSNFRSKISCRICTLLSKWGLENEMACFIFFVKWLIFCRKLDNIFITYSSLWFQGLKGSTIFSVAFDNKMWSGVKEFISLCQPLLSATGFDRLI